MITNPTAGRKTRVLPSRSLLFREHIDDEKAAQGRAELPR